MSWFAAEASCESHGPRVNLVSIHSQAENDLVDSRSTGTKWIGLTDHNKTPKAFNWIDDSNYGGSEFTNWARGNPKQVTANGDCGVMGIDGKWLDEPCEPPLYSGKKTGKQKAFTCKSPGKKNNFVAVQEESQMLSTV